MVPDVVTKITIPAIPPSLNTWSRWHWTRRAEVKQKWKLLVSNAVGRHRVYTVPVVITIIYRFPSQHRRDLDNYAPKFILDGLVGGLLPDDNHRWIRELRIRFTEGTGPPQTEIEVMHAPAPEPS